jgi:hypothetical protein
MWYPYQAALGYNADLDITWVGSDISDGLLGSITVGLNMFVSLKFHPSRGLIGLSQVLREC